MAKQTRPICLIIKDNAKNSARTEPLSFSQISKQISELATDFTNYASSNSPDSSGVWITDISTVDFGVAALEASDLPLLRCFAFTGVLNNSAIPKKWKQTLF